MRSSLARWGLIAFVGVALAGCSTSSSSKPSFWQSLSWGKSKSTPAASNLATAPPAPNFQAAPTAPVVAQGNPQVASQMQMHPGTNYPVTPYPEHNVAGAPAPAANAYAANPYATTNSPAANPYGATPSQGYGQTYSASSTPANTQYTQQPSSAYDYSAANPSGTVAR
jgi:hypothetical protein